MNRYDFTDALRKRLLTTDINKVKQDVSPFIKNQDELNIWSNDYFVALSERMVYL
jgi:hypothetical protein